jgi:lysophospholipase L1-like esterase
LFIDFNLEKQAIIIQNLNWYMNKIILIFTLLVNVVFVYGQAIKVACLGNSVTYGLGIDYLATNAYPAQLQYMLGNHYQVKNFGKSGATLLRKGHQPYWKTSEFADALSFQPDIAIIHLGLNDTDPRNWPAYQDEFMGDYSRLIDTLRTINPDIEIFIALLSPIFPGHRRFKSGTRDWHRQINSIIPNIAHANDVQLIDFFNPLYSRPDLLPDQIHPNKEGATILARTVYSAVTGDFGGLQVDDVFQNGAVIQSGKQSKIFGKANPGELIQIDFQNHQFFAQVSEFGTWQAKFPNLSPGGPFPLTIVQGKQKIQLDSVFVGDVWLLMGQSNMEWSYKPEIFSANSSSGIFTYQFSPIAKTNNTKWQDSIQHQANSLNFFTKKWSPIAKNSDFSAVGYYFAHHLKEKTQVPIGLIQIAVGGAPIESFLPRMKLENDDLLVDLYKDWRQSDFVMKWVRERASINVDATHRHPFQPSFIYESAIKPLLPFTFKGVLWYQGESNTHNPSLYNRMYPILVEDFRENQQPDLPFYFVQLPRMSREEWPYFRAMQATLSAEIPHNFMAVAIDLGDSLDVHPPDKREISKRLAQLVLKNSYGDEAIRTGAIVAKRAIFQQNRLEIEFDSPDKLKTNNGESPLGFEWINEKGIRRTCDAKIVDNKVWIEIPMEAGVPQQIYYGFQPFPTLNLSDEAGLPVAPFRMNVEFIPNLIPKPQKATFQNRYVRIENADALLLEIDKRLLEKEFHSFQFLWEGIFVQVKKMDGNLKNDEGYKLEIKEGNIEIGAKQPVGVFYAIQTLRQLVNQNQWPNCQIEDWPAFRIRGFMHDVGRSFIPIEELKEQIRILSRYKINAFHWHLTEDLAWRLESELYPELTNDENFQRFPGQFYKKEEVRELIEFAKRHFVTVIPEIDMPGHSAAFERAFGFKMQTDQGKVILRELLKEAGELFKGQPYFHIGTDEVGFTDPNFVPEMVELLRSLGFKVASWNPGWKYQPGEIDLLQLWSYKGKPVPGIPYVDSKFHYINHFDSYADLVGLYKSNVAGQSEGNDMLLGSILATWNDRKLTNSDQILAENNFYPLMLTFSERLWRGGGEGYFDQVGTLLNPNDSDWIDFENRLIMHRDLYFDGKPFPYFKQSDLKWRISPPLDNGGDLEKIFPEETSLIKGNIPEGFKRFFGAGIYLRHVWGTLVPGVLTDPKPNHTVFASMNIYSPKDQKAFIHLGFQNYSRSEKDLPPPSGEWDWKRSKIWWNGNPIDPPVWINKHQEKSNEIDLTNENWTSRPPIAVDLKRGWNHVLLKLPVGQFQTEELRLVKWMFNFNLVGENGKEISDLLFE